MYIFFIRYDKIQEKTITIIKYKETMYLYLGMCEYIIIYAIKIDVLFLFFIVSLYKKSFDFYK